MTKSPLAGKNISAEFLKCILTLVNVYVTFPVFTHIACTSKSGCGRFFHFVGVNTDQYFIEKHAICQRDNKLQSFLSIQYVHGDLCKHLGTDSSTDRIPFIRIGTGIYS